MKKPLIGETCNGCGICCMSQPCRNGAYVLGLVTHLGETVSGRCPALVQGGDGAYRCGIVLNPPKYIKKSKYPAAVLSRNFAFLIGAGNGCDELLDNDTPEQEVALEKKIATLQQDAEWLRRAKIAINVIHH
jgi:hypothetical protein